MSFIHEFRFAEAGGQRIAGTVRLGQPQAGEAGILYRRGALQCENGAGLEIVLTHGPATGAFIYCSARALTARQGELIGIGAGHPLCGRGDISLPGQLVLGAERTALVTRGIAETLSAPEIAAIVNATPQRAILVAPILREGMKYGVAEALFARYGHICGEIVVDAHHVFDDADRIYRRGVEVTLFKDADLSEAQRLEITTVFIGDSVASGTVLLGVMQRMRERFPRLERIEIVAPFATVRGLARLAALNTSSITLRVHSFETLLNVLPPDHYFSPHFPQPEFHIRPDLQAAYAAWWGRDDSGTDIADTACAGYGWSEAFFSPRKQIEMMNGELTARHGLTIAEILTRACG